MKITGSVRRLFTNVSVIFEVSHPALLASTLTERKIRTNTDLVVANRLDALLTGLKAVKRNSDSTLVVGRGILDNQDFIALRRVSIFVYREGFSLANLLTADCYGWNMSDALAVAMNLNFCFSFPANSADKNVEIVQIPRPIDRELTFLSYDTKTFWLDVAASYLRTGRTVFSIPTGKRGCIVVSPNAAGKSWAVVNDRFKSPVRLYDGDTLVNWPKTYRWWETMPRGEQVAMGLKHLEKIGHFARSTGSVVLFNPNSESLALYVKKAVCEVVVILPPVEDHLENMKSRLLHQKGQGSGDVIPLRHDLQQLARKLKLRVLLGRLSDLRPLPGCSFVDLASIISVSSILRPKRSLAHVANDGSVIEFNVRSDEMSEQFKEMYGSLVDLAFSTNWYGVGHMSHLGATMAERNKLPWGSLLRPVLASQGSDFIRKHSARAPRLAKYVFEREEVTFSLGEEMDVVISDRSVDISGHFFSVLMAATFCNFDVFRYLSVLKRFLIASKKTPINESIVDVRVDQIGLAKPTLLHKKLDYIYAIYAYLGLVVSRRIFTFKAEGILDQLDSIAQWVEKTYEAL